ncbi:hypothetical protein FE782_10410 [Paenibacillus antri]|uniref:Uncharacterized protein n=1 Tax=Paenibacillus antri TaxID=2582848 RepID=A0A5R9GKU8_9BACL|nr:hypothetical protein [Paenibacillus antri]TLS52375.1 hypothetical protein FE782_10410 [Paenibacillus antri]
MLASTVGTSQPKRWKRIGFGIVAVLFALFGFFFLQGATEALEPWVPSDCGGCNDETFVPDSYRWLAASHGALLAFLFGGCLIALLRKPYEKPVLLHVYAVGHIAFLAVLAITSPQMALQKAFVFVMFLLVLLVLFAFYHRRSAAIKLEPAGGYTRPLLAMTVAAALILVPVAIHAGMQQMGETADQFRWGEEAAMLLVLLYAGFLASAKRAGSFALGVIVSLTYVYLGAAALAVPNHPGSWGVAGGMASIVFGLAFAGTIFYTQRSR